MTAPCLTCGTPRPSATWADTFIPCPNDECTTRNRKQVRYTEHWQDRERWDWQRDVQAAKTLYELRQGR